MGSIRKRPDRPKPYLARYRDPDRRERSKSFRRKVDAEHWLSEREREKYRGEWVDPDLARTTFSEWSERWWGTTAHLKPYTRAGYESLLRVQILPRFGERALVGIRPVDVGEWLSDLRASGLSVSRTRQAYFLFGQIVRSAVESGYLAKSPCIGLKLPRMQQREMHFLSAGEVRDVAEAIQEPYGTLVYVLAYTGLRWGEACALRRGRCELLRSRLHVVESVAEVEGFHFGPTKTYERRTLVIPGFLRDFLAAHLAAHVLDDPEAVVFASSEGTPLRRGNWNRRQWRPALETAGIEYLTPHELRHTCASLLIQRGANPKQVQAYLGHSSIQVTMDRYGHLFPSDMEALADRLDAAFADARADQARTKGRGEVVELPG